MTLRFKNIPIVVANEQTSGQKYVNEEGIKAIYDGLPRGRYSHIPHAKKPEWLKQPYQHTEKFEAVKNRVHEKKLHTVCEEAKCPNIQECWSAGTATLMIMGSVCTRACKFCAVDTGNPKGWLDADEPEKAADTVAEMGLQYVVITSVDRDDLPDGGAMHFASTVKAIKAKNPNTAVEALTPDFQGDTAAIDILAASGIAVFAQNLETVERLTHVVRDKKAGYTQTLDMLRYAKKTYPHILTKTSLMLGVGETDEEVLVTLKEISAFVDIVTLGQYLRPTLNHLPLDRYVSPEEFNALRDKALAFGFLEVVAGPFVRSSYRAERALPLVRHSRAGGNPL
jgi:lipoic acid synthetase